MGGWKATYFFEGFQRGIDDSEERKEDNYWIQKAIFMCLDYLSSYWVCLLQSIDDNEACLCTFD